VDDHRVGFVTGFVRMQYYAFGSRSDIEEERVVSLTSFVTAPDFQEYAEYEGRFKEHYKLGADPENEIVIFTGTG
jgi:hypothetical protein